MSWFDQPTFIGCLCFVAGSLVSYSLLRWRHRQHLQSVAREAHLRAEEESIRLRDQLEGNYTDRQKELAESEHRLTEREALINRQLENLVAEETSLRQQQQSWEEKQRQLQVQQVDLAKLTLHRRQELERLTKLNETEARAMFMKETELSALRDAGTLTRHILDDARSRAEEKARGILSVAIQRYAAEHTFETTSATLTLPNEDLKGRIIGREGRNIRAFEAATGVTVLIDDTPNAVVLSAFDPVRREVARQSMERLIQDGRIHPTRIEEVVSKVSQELEETIQRAGEEAVFKAGLPPFHLEIVRLLGRLNFRHSFSQNILQHSVEVAHLTGLMAAELGLKVDTARRAGLLHDIGKAVNHEVEGPHALVGSDLLRHYGEPEDVVQAVASHHDETPHNGPLGILVGAADAISASRPGARSETMTTYIKRVEDLERLGLSFPGVEKCFAVQAGRELRIFVQPEVVSDEEAYNLAKNISRKIENDLQYPGQIRVTVMRETRCVEFAK